MERTDPVAPRSGALVFEDVHKAFGAVRALAGVSFTVAPGDAHACVGENGAGKSTLLKILAGLVRPDRGTVTLDGIALDHAAPREALSAGVGMVFQERLAFPDLSVSANIFAGREIVTRGGRLDESAMGRRTREILDDLHVPIAPDQPMAHVSAAHAQLVQVARALAFDCRVLVLDEPTTSLTDAEVAHLFGVLARLRTQGVTILFVSHRLPEVFALCSAITVLRDGRSVATLDRDDTSPAEVARAMVGRDLPARPDRPLRPGAPVLAVRGLSRPPLVRDVSFEIGAGEVVALFGLVGSGRTEVLETLFGLAAPSAGDVRVGGRPGSWRDPRQAMAAGLALVPEDRQRLGLHYNLSLADNLALARGAAGPARINRVTERARADRSIRELGLKTPSPDASPDTLSGGNQQKAVLGKWLATNPRVLLLDEPTQGVDVGAKFEIHRLIRDRAEGGTACLVASSDLPEVLALADRVLVMRQGRIVADLATADATEEAVMQAATHDEAGEAP